MCASIDAASGWICTTVTSSPASLTNSLNAISRGSLVSMNSTTRHALPLAFELAWLEPIGRDKDERRRHGGLSQC